ncbi:sigma 54-interacting transcriptional regulator [Pendulispora rubella]|uniref:Sigma 54-interacting transcriptional regulator n=1 Tax=Pendulispora rubella TaxID=2741070 RepID=A0ABZ2KSU4_9BACT
MNLDDWVATGAHELADVVRLADGTEAALDELLQRGLEWLGRIAPYDLAVVFELEGAELRARAARGALASPDVRTHRIRLDDWPSIRLAVEERRSRVFTEEDHAHGEGDPFDGLMDFPHGHACMVVPLTTGREVFGIMSLDRTECQTYPRPVVDLAEVFGRLLALSIQCIKQGQKLAEATLHGEERIQALDRHLEAMTEQAGILEGSRVPKVRDLARQARLVASTNSTVLLLGETGTGKERLARYIHDASPRSQRPFIPVNCAALPSNLLESELFGHERGAFTGAVRARSGLFRAANGGTLFLDEVGELPPELQGKLLRALQGGEITPVGSERTIQVDVRVVAATHVDLEHAVAARRFREDLYYRLSVYPLYLVPLRERKDDVPLLAEALLRELAPRVGKSKLRLSRAALEALERLDFPGNVRELSNVLERGAIRADSSIIDVAHLRLTKPAGKGARASSPPSEGDALVSLAENERLHIARVLEATGGRLYGQGGAAEILGIPPSTLQSRMKRLGMPRASDR